ncbi:hypothetical protein [Bradyrhizobium sp. USDA 4451]
MDDDFLPRSPTVPRLMKPVCIEDNCSNQSSVFRNLSMSGLCDAGKEIILLARHRRHSGRDERASS